MLEKVYVKVLDTVLLRTQNLTGGYLQISMSSFKEKGP